MKTDVWYDAVEASGIDLNHDHADWRIVPIIVEAALEDATAINETLETVEWEDLSRLLVQFIQASASGNYQSIGNATAALSQLISLVRTQCTVNVETQREMLLGQALERRKEHLESRFSEVG